MITPTTCETCGFGRLHICERSVCCCNCHEPEIRPEHDLAAASALKASLEDLDSSEPSSTFYRLAA